MTMPPQRPKLKITTEAKRKLPQEVHNKRTRIIKALTTILEDLPREAAGLLDTRPPAGYPNTCFLWPSTFLDDESLWHLDCIVSKTGWPNLLWVVDVFAWEFTE
jgi:hypothetical protein